MSEARPGAVVLHGLTGHPQSVEGVADALRAAGFDVNVPLLPGHGTTVEDLERSGWDDWVGAARDARDQVAERNGPLVGLVGLSMGGSLACRLAAEAPDAVAGLVVINPFIDPPAPSFREALDGIKAAGYQRVPGIGGDVADPSGGGEPAYAELPIDTLLSLCEGLDDLLPRLPRISCPVLLMTSRVDHVVPTVSSDVLAERVSGPVERVWLERSFHVATLDNDRDQVERCTVDFLAKAVSRVRSPDG